MAKKEFAITVKFTYDQVRRMNELIKQDKFDTRSSFIRRAVVEYLNQLEQKILA